MSSLRRRAEAARRALCGALLALGATLALFLSASAAQAQPKRVAVLEFEGPSGSAFQAQITRALRDRSELELVSSRDVQNTAERLGNAMETDADYREIAEALELSAFVEGTVVKRRRELNAKVSVRDAKSGEVIHDETWRRRRSQVKQIRPLVWRALGPAISDSAQPVPSPAAKPTRAPEPEPEPEPPVAPEPEPTEPEPVAKVAPEPAPNPRRTRRTATEPTPPAAPAKPPEPKPAARSARRGSEHPTLVLSIGPRLMWRELSYDDETNFAGYHADSLFFLPLRAQYYPSAYFSRAWHTNLGLELDFEYGFGLRTAIEGKKNKTTAYEVGVGAIYRIPRPRFEPYLRLGYVQQGFAVEQGSAMLLPDVTYRLLRLGIGSSVKIAAGLSADVSLAYLAVLGAGQLASQQFAEDAESNGWEIGLGALYQFEPRFAARLAFDYRRYNHDFSLTDNPMVARLPNGGTDSYSRLTLSFVYSLRSPK